MPPRNLLAPALIVLVTGLVAGCNLPAPAASPSPAPTSQAPATANPTPQAVTAVAQATATSEIVHAMRPGEPGQADHFVSDRSSAQTAGERRASADFYDISWLERPFSAEEMEYRPELDLTRAEISVAPPWVYAALQLQSAPIDDSAYYGVELDLDSDGSGDWLIWGRVQGSTEWTVTGVQIHLDQDNDVGASAPMTAEAPQAESNGYETLLFESGVGPDPDAAWIRISPNSDDRVELAFKYELIDRASEFLWGAWADAGPSDPTQFDYHDIMTLEQAGSPLSSSPYYPLAGLAQVDNTCRWTFGFTPQRRHPGMCPLAATATPAASNTPTVTATEEPTWTIAGLVFEDLNRNGFRDGGSEPGFNGATLVLRQQNCTTGVYASTSSNASGGYSFQGIPAGTYCVELTQWPDKYEPTTSTSYAVDVGPDEFVYFGLALKQQ